MTKSTEIERRFLSPAEIWQGSADKANKLFICQGYPDSLQKDDGTGRVRSTLQPDGSILFEQTVKGVMIGLSTPEDEYEVQKSTFTQLMQEAGIQNLKKWRWPILWEGVEFVVDQFTHIRNDRSDLVIAEIEFLSEAGARAFTPPTWIGREITGEHQWSNYSLCTAGEPSH